jgi:hypothetical protein
MKTLLGVWVGIYPQGETAVAVQQDGNILRAVKVAQPAFPDDGAFVRSGAVSWELDLDTLQARGFVAEQGQVNYRSVPATVEFAPDSITVRWDRTTPLVSNQYEVTYRKVGI